MILGYSLSVGNFIVTYSAIVSSKSLSSSYRIISYSLLNSISVGGLTGYTTILKLQGPYYIYTVI